MVFEKKFKTHEEKGDAVVKYPFFLVDHQIQMNHLMN